MRVLVVNPALVRLTSLGACEQDRLTNVHNLIRYGHEVRLLTRFMKYQQPNDVEAFYGQMGINTQLVAPSKHRIGLRRLRDIAFLDGAAWEYQQPEFLNALDSMLHEFQPDLVWCHASYLWAPAAFARRRGYRTVIRSVNYEPAQLLQEQGQSPANRLRYLGKSAGERRAAHTPTVLAAITPDESAIYQRLKPRAQVKLLPLQTLPNLLRPPRPARDRRLIHVFFMGASYNIPHNRAALRFITDQIIPMIREQSPETFVFHLLGQKVPSEIQALTADDLIFEGYVPNLDEFFQNMDVALCPSLFGVGMQQKVFEPLCRGFPTITHRRALAGYPFENGIHVLTADEPSGFVEHLFALCDPALRENLSAQAAARAAELFEREVMDKRLNDIIQTQP